MRIVHLMKILTRLNDYPVSITERVIFSQQNIGSFPLCILSLATVQIVLITPPPVDAKVWRCGDRANHHVAPYAQVRMTVVGGAAW